MKHALISLLLVAQSHGSLITPHSKMICKNEKEQVEIRVITYMTGHPMAGVGAFEAVFQLQWKEETVVDLVKYQFENKETFLEVWGLTFPWLSEITLFFPKRGEDSPYTLRVQQQTIGTSWKIPVDCEYLEN